MLKSALRLLILMAVIVTVAALLGGWKWGDSAPTKGATPAVVTSAAS